jgi:D-glycero-alpha-D-manno-heptose-7-phosphate kinase
MILVKTPFRISFVGGGTDLPAFYRRHGHGAVVSAAIDKYMYVMIHPYFHDKLRVKYSQTEDVDRIDELKHPIVRECLRLMNVTSGVEIASIADIPAGLGVGSSSSFTVCLLHALHTYRGRHVTKEALAREACRIEIQDLGEPIGKQDQYAASYGGLNYVRFNSDESVEVERLVTNHELTVALFQRLLVFYVGNPRAARDILSRQQATIGAGDQFRAAQGMVQLAEDLRRALQDGELNLVGKILHEGWLLKKSLAGNISNGEIDRLYDAALAAGAGGGKLLGAGGGGFLLFYCEPKFQASVRRALALRELPITLDREGTKVIYSE